LADKGTTRELPPKQRNSPRDWEVTFQDWIKSGIPKVKYLRSIGLNPQSGYVHRKTREWDKRLEILAAGVRDTHVAQQINTETKGIQTPEDLKERKDNIPQTPPEETAADIAPMIGRSSDVKPQAQMSAWQAVQAWRRKQSKSDYETAEQARLAIKLILKDSIRRVDAEGGFATSLKPHEVRQLTQAISDVQRIQRLALGLSTENIGVDSPAPVSEGHVEKNITPTEEASPVFQVVMSSRGKFLRPRPRRVN
jgi:hypothetical protein